MIRDTPEQYERDTEALAQQYLDVAKYIAATAGVPCDLMHVEHEHPYTACARSRFSGKSFGLRSQTLSLAMVPAESAGAAIGQWGE